MIRPLLLLLAACAPEAPDGAKAADDTAVDAPDDTAAGDDTAGDDTGEPAAVAPPCPEWDPADFATVYEVGPGQPLAEPDEVPWESLEAGTLVRIHWRERPYAAKWVLDVVGTEGAPIVVQGVPDGDRLPVVTGDSAVTRLDLDYWNEARSVIKIGGSSQRDDEARPAWITVQQLEIRSAHPAYAFTDDGGGAGTYADNAASVHIEQGDHITVCGSTLTDSGNGLFVGNGATDVLVRANHIHGNGIVGSFYEHNSYTEALGITFELNRYGPLREGADGNNLKDRSAGTVIRTNWIEGGNRQLDLVESGSETLRGDPRYRDTFVYGNVLVEPDGAGNSQVVHYGGDNGDEDRYRKGTLHLFHNTIVSTRSGNTTLLRLSSADESADVRNNVVWAEAGRLAISDAAGTIDLHDNWLSQGWTDSHSGLIGRVTEQGTAVGTDPGFVDAVGQDFALVEDATAVDAAGALPAAATDHPVDLQYVPHQDAEARPDDGAPDLGALERE